MLIQHLLMSALVIPVHSCETCVSYTIVKPPAKALHFHVHSNVVTDCNCWCPFMLAVGNDDWSVLVAAVA